MTNEQKIKRPLIVCRTNNVFYHGQNCADQYQFFMTPAGSQEHHPFVRHPAMCSIQYNVDHSLRLTFPEEECTRFLGNSGHSYFPAMRCSLAMHLFPPEGLHGISLFEYLGGRTQLLDRCVGTTDHPDRAKDKKGGGAGEYPRLWGKDGQLTVPVWSAVILAEISSYSRSIRPVTFVSKIPAGSS